MYYVVVYDIASAKRLPRILKICRKYLNWVQNSVFEGELNRSQYSALNKEIKAILNKKEDFVVFYQIRTREVVNRITLGFEKNEMSFFI